MGLWAAPHQAPVHPCLQQGEGLKLLACQAAVPLEQLVLTVGMCRAHGRAHPHQLVLLLKQGSALWVLPWEASLLRVMQHEEQLAGSIRREDGKTAVSPPLDPEPDLLLIESDLQALH